MGLSELLKQFEALRDDIAGGKYASALRDFSPIVEALADLATAIGFQAGPKDAAIKAKIQATFDECCDLAASPPVAAAADPHGVGKLGDGTFLKLLLEALKVILPLVL